MSSSQPSNESSEQGLPESPPGVVEGHGPGASGRDRWSPWEWIWQSKKAKKLREEDAKLSDRARQYMARAQTSLDAAEHLVQLRNPEGDVTALSPATDLLKQGASWAALSLLDPGAGAQDQEPKLDAEGWARVSAQAGIANGAELWETWLSKPSEAAWESPPSRDQLNRFLELTSELVRYAHRTSFELDALWFRRTYRIGLPLVVAALGVGILAYSSHRQAVLAETAYAWKSSSTIGDGCTSPSQECSEVRYFFHTGEENEPWIEFDLGAESEVRGLRVANRNECAECPARAVPLVVEISSDHENWTEVGRKQKTFDDWDLSVEKRARWVRLRALKKTFLHFRQVRIRASS